jgi:DNA (cytosine-5)-methyltransferase 1
MRYNKMKVVSLFCGIGGFDKGFSDAGFEIKWANDIDKYAVQTYRANWNNKIVCDDIYNIPINEIPDFDVLVGGFPCQPFSLMGGQKGFDDTRGTVFFRIAEIIKEKSAKGKKPKAIILENVRNLYTHNNGKTFAKIKHVLEKKLKYKVFSDILNTADYGIPQTRNRTYIVCFSNPNAEFTWPSKINLKTTLQDLLEENVEEKYYLSDRIIPTILSNGSGKYSARSEIDLKIARPLCATMAKMHRACQDNYVTQSGKIRKLTPRECARLQGFSDDFIIPVSNAQAYKQFGNAVTINVTHAIAKEVRNTLEKFKEW